MALLQSLTNSCVSEPLSNQWWRVTWCSGREITQLHREGVNDVVTHSLGRFSAKSLYFDSVSNASLFYKEQFGSGGSYCDEVKRPRTSEARLFCCSDTGADDIELQWFVESSTCQYVVCVPRA